jgi:hypothetical protein
MQLYVEVKAVRTGRLSLCKQCLILLLSLDECFLEEVGV